MKGLARDLDLELLGDMGFVEGAAAVGADMRQGRLVDLVDLFGAGRLAVGLGAVVLAGLAPRRLGLASGRSLGEGSGLALASTLLLFEQAGQPLDVGLQFSHTALERLAARAGGLNHTGIMANRPTFSGAGRHPSRAQGRLTR